MNWEVIANWIMKCYQWRQDGFFYTKKAVLVLDSMHAHITPEVKNTIKTKNTIPAVIPGGLTKILQLLDVTVNCSFQAEIRKLWENWISSRIHHFTATGCMRRAIYAAVAQTGWLTAWECVPTSCITSSFRKADYSSSTRPRNVHRWTYRTVMRSRKLATTLTNPLKLPASTQDTEDKDFEGFTPSDIEDGRSIEWLNTVTMCLVL